MAQISKVITFIPTIGGNDKKSEAERFAVKLKAVKVDKKQNQLRKFIDADPKKLMKDMMDSKQQTEIVNLLNEHFVRFVNFDVVDVATDEDVKAGKKGRLQDSESLDEVSLAEGDEYLRPAQIGDIFELGEYELAMEIFMHMIGSSQLRRTLTGTTSGDGGGGKELPTVTDEREDEEKNSESPSGTTTIPNVH
jgi:hypothetical protein